MSDFYHGNYHELGTMTKCENCLFYLNTPECKRSHALARGEVVELEIIE